MTTAKEHIVASLVERPTILVVCTGNICRSPMGEVVLRARLCEEGLGGVYTVRSCGVSDEEHGNPIYPSARSVLQEAGYTIPDHVAHRGIDEELKSAGLILAMTVGHARAVRSRLLQLGVDVSVLHLWREFDGSGLLPAPYGCCGVGGFLDVSDGGVRHSGYSDFYSSDGVADVPDPWYGPREGFYDTLACIEAGARGVVDMLKV